MNTKKKAVARPLAITKGKALGMLLQDRLQVASRIELAANARIALNTEESAATEALELANGKLALFMREHNLKSVRCAGFLLTDQGDRVHIVADHYADLSA